jgi:hypothetical protein
LAGKSTIADALRSGDASLASTLACRLIKPFNNNLVPRPWGGSRMLAYKDVATPTESNADLSEPIGEAFEISAYDDDAEARRFPSIVGFADGSTLELPDLLEANAEALLGRAFVERYGARFPLLPKTLDVKELLSVQGHPPGNTEVYVILAAEPGATIRVGFGADVDPARLREALVAGRRQQAELVELLGGPKADLISLQRALAPWLAARGAPAEDVAATVTRLLEFSSDWPAARALLEAMKQTYWRVLDGLNVVPVGAGQVVYNATPERFLSGDMTASAEVHALGNPEGHEVLALEIRRPGPTFRAWDNVRFPVREIDIDAALGSLNLRATTIDDFLVVPEAVAGRPGVYCSVDSPAFRVEHLRPAAEFGVSVPAEAPHCLHAIDGTVDIRGSDGRSLGRLRRGESALVPVAVGPYTVSTEDAGSEVVKVSVPL